MKLLEIKLNQRLLLRKLFNKFRKFRIVLLFIVSVLFLTMPCSLVTVSICFLFSISFVFFIRIIVFSFTCSFDRSFYCSLALLPSRSLFSLALLLFRFIARSFSLVCSIPMHNCVCTAFAFIFIHNYINWMLRIGCISVKTASQLAFLRFFCSIVWLGAFICKHGLHSMKRIFLLNGIFLWRSFNQLKNGKPNIWKRVTKEQKHTHSLTHMHTLVYVRCFVTIAKR